MSTSLFFFSHSSLVFYSLLQRVCYHTLNKTFGRSQKNGLQHYELSNRLETYYCFMPPAQW